MEQTRNTYRSLQSILSIRCKSQSKMRPNWLVVGLCGVTNSGKTSLAKALQARYPGAHYICQDSYFRPVTWPGHVYVPEVDHFNWDVMSALDMETMVKDVHQLVDGEPEGSEQGILILDGFLLLCHQEISEMCNIKVYIDLEYEEVKRRRDTRSYDPPDPPGYFDKIVWPESRVVREKIISTFSRELLLLNGKDPVETNTDKISVKMNALLKSS
ncbi:nicotinamide riboside kinase 1 isoform X3 [Halyomorpha halys]|uniref:nicotinamide riboside kinase 1 isoform X3 n=1 Tax=Halyomorpha halys TaxID=286706 RepID=UPI0006D4EA67|nr:nicotinamide riboside kinase 1 isoform X3 [Halyomorpha halys]XP_014293740.1 nicotinamide riboside kinase 1 isoform X3 [Halyomorpha halys]